MLDGRDRRGEPMPVMLASPDAGRHRRRNGIQPTRRYIRKDEREIFEGVEVATIARAAYDLALDAPNLTEAVVYLDMCTSTTIAQARTPLDNVHRLVARHKKTRGIVTVREALTWVSSRSASPWETRTRLLAAQGAGIRGLLVNVPVFDLDGELLGVVDLLDPETGLAIETDGDHHRSRAQHTDDNRREERFERSGMTVCRVTSLDHRDPIGTVQRLRRAHRDAHLTRRRTWTLHKPQWWHAWEPGRRWD